jgi:hypothetical protein
MSCLRFLFLWEIHTRKIHDVCSCSLLWMSRRNTAKHKEETPTVMEPGAFCPLSPLRYLAAPSYVNCFPYKPVMTIRIQAIRVSTYKNFAVKYSAEFQYHLNKYCKYSLLLLLIAKEPYWCWASSMRFLYHTQIHYTQQDSSGRVVRPTQRPLPYNIQ